ncbi:MAG: hypothetical protein IPJ67_04110 [Candidatus Moraniibacteriota bacterium]|nr:MAG: hypothetical protein IPJ67_04110 [Candidatus Moranbacteria bacterium]
MRSFLQKHRELWTNSAFVRSVLEGVFFLATSIVANHFASAYADIWASNSVTDIILDNIPVLDVDGLLGVGALFLGLFLLGTCLALPKSIPFVLKSVALFILIRSMFIVLTHLGPSPDKVVLDDGVLFARLLSGNDLFFSGHTGLPFLIALLFWDIVFVRVVFLSMSIVFAIGVLVGHLHYSIDVFSAFFITYSIFRIAQSIFPEAWKWQHEDTGMIR